MLNSADFYDIAPDFPTVSPSCYSQTTLKWRSILEKQTHHDEVDRTPALDDGYGSFPYSGFSWTGDDAADLPARDAWIPIRPITPKSLESSTSSNFDSQASNSSSEASRSRKRFRQHVVEESPLREPASPTVVTRARRPTDDRILLRNRLVARNSTSNQPSTAAGPSGKAFTVPAVRARPLMLVRPVSHVTSSNRSGMKGFDDLDSEEDEEARERSVTISLSSLTSASTSNSRRSGESSSSARPENSRRTSGSMSKLLPGSSHSLSVREITAETIEEPLERLLKPPTLHLVRPAPPRTIGQRNRMMAYGYARKRGPTHEDGARAFQLIDLGNSDEEDLSVDLHAVIASSLTSAKKLGKIDFVMCADMSHGQELFPVRLWNDVNDIRAPPPFIYITALEDTAGYVRTPCVCQCMEACDDVRCHCMSEPFNPNVTEWPYDLKTGFLLNPRSWLTSPYVIWECSPGCRCGPNCPSRSAQLGLRYPFEIFMTKEKGWGVRPLRDLPAGAFVAEYFGEVKEDFDEPDLNWYTFALTQDGGDGRSFYIDAREKGNMSRFINHGCFPNLCPVHVYYDDSNMQRGTHIGFFTVRKVKAYEELTLDYSQDFWRAKIGKDKYCKCGSTKCRYKAPSASKTTKSGKSSGK